MNFLWPGALIGLLIIPLTIGAYIFLNRRRRKVAIRYSSLSIINQAVSHQSWLRRHLVFILFLLTLTSLAFALARPQATVTIPSNKATIVLAIDISHSMCAVDIAPNRLEVAKDAAQAFIQDRRSGRQVGLVVFAGFAELIQPPTTDTRALNESIENLITGRRTAIGSAILRSIDAIAEVDDRIPPIDISASAGTLELPPSDEEYSPHIIVLLTDGASNAGPYPLTAATQAAARGIRVYTIGFGTEANLSTLNCPNFYRDENDFRSFGFGPQSGSSRNFRLAIDEVTLMQVADMTGGSYYYAASANELNDVFQNLPTFIVATRETIEISVFFTAFALVLIVTALFLSFRWHVLG